MKQTKFRIVPICDEKGVRYCLQYKGLFFWNKYTKIHSSGFVTYYNYQCSWHTVEEAVNYIRNKYGQNARIITWRG